MELAGVAMAAALVVAAVLAATALAARRGPDPAAVRALEGLAQGLGRLQADLTRLSRAQDDLRQEMGRGREASLLQLSDVAQGLRGEIGQAQRALAEVKAIEQGRARQMEQASDSLRRLEAVVAGSSTRGAAGENILARALAQLPADLLEVNVSFGNKVVEYALRLPGGRFLPIDSKWTSVGLVERLEAADQPLDRKRLVDQIARDVRGRIREMGKYLDPERTLSLGLLAVPDAVYEAAPEAHGEGYRAGVLVVPYSLALPYVLALYRLTIRFGCAVDTDQLADRIRGLEETLRQIDEEVEGRLSRGLVQAGNARDSLRDHVVEARRATQKLLLAAEAEPPARVEPALSGPRPLPHVLPAAVAEID
ncbi:MAG TPA: DNA recombination protein RmuC [Vicinamibacteria bacterium]|nr:DNA recombination protein RmuC [Vicinamibacteria bacterium]